MRHQSGGLLPYRREFRFKSEKRDQTFAIGGVRARVVCFSCRPRARARRSLCSSGGSGGCCCCCYPSPCLLPYIQSALSSTLGLEWRKKPRTLLCEIFTSTSLSLARACIYIYARYMLTSRPLSLSFLSSFSLSLSLSLSFFLLLYLVFARKREK